MKKYLLSICCIVIALSFCSCTQDNLNPTSGLETTTKHITTPQAGASANKVLEMENMPEPFQQRQGNTGGDELDSYKYPYKQEFYSIDFTLIEAVGMEAFDEWRSTFEYAGGTRPDAEHTIVDFVKKFDISKERLKQYVNENIQWAKDNGNDSPRPIYSEKAIEAMYGTQEEINQYFVSDFSILKDGKIYTPEWLYTHSVEEYEAEGLDPQQVRSRISLYENIPFTLEAEEAFSDKLRTFTGQGLETEAPIPPAETTPAPPMVINAETTPLPEGFDPSLFDESPAESAPSTTDGSVVDTGDGLQ